MEEMFKELEEYAKKYNVPIIQKEGLDILLKYVNETKPTNILEIGTAIGYSALKMNSLNDANILTFEREEELVKKAQENLEKFNKQDKIRIIDQDFLNYDLGNQIFDLIYVDGAKAQYYNFFKHFENNMNEKTIVIFDNLLFHDYVFNEEKKLQASRNLKQLIRKIETFLQKIWKEKGYTFFYTHKGDGIGILRKKDE